MSNIIWAYKYNDYNDIMNFKKDIRVINIYNDDFIETYKIEGTFINIQNISRLRKEHSKVKYISNNIEEHFYDLRENFCLKLIIIREIKVIFIFSDKNKYINYAFCKGALEKVNLTNNVIFTKIFESKFSENLVGINFKSESQHATIDQVELYGNNLLESDILFDMELAFNDMATKIIRYSFQPEKYAFIVHIKSPNKIEVRNKHLSEDDIDEFLYDFSTALLSEWGEFNE